MNYNKNQSENALKMSIVKLLLESVRLSESYGGGSQVKKLQNTQI